MTRIARKQVKWWAVIFLPILLRALVPVGFMPMVGPGFTVRLVVCEGYAPMPRMAAMPPGMPMDAPMAMPVDMPMDMPMDAQTDGTSGAAHSHGRTPAHDDHGGCPYGSAPALGALPTLADLPAQLMRRSLELSLATAQLTFVEVSPRAQSPRGPPA